VKGSHAEVARSHGLLCKIILKRENIPMLSNGVQTRNSAGWIKAGSLTWR